MSLTDKDIEAIYDHVMPGTDTSIMIAAALAGIRTDLAALTGELRDLRYSLERGR